MEYLQSPTLGFQARFRRDPGMDDFQELRGWQQSVWLAVPLLQVCRAPRKRELLAIGFVPGRTRQSLLAQRLVVVYFAAGALWNGQLMIGAP